MKKTQELMEIEDRMKDSIRSLFSYMMVHGVYVDIHGLIKQVDDYAFSLNYEEVRSAAREMRDQND